MRDLRSPAKREGKGMNGKQKPLFVILLSVAAFVLALSIAPPIHAQNVQVDLSSTSALCGGQECFNADGLFTVGTTFLGTSFMDGANAGNCTPPPQFPGCPDAYSASPFPGLGLSTANPPTLTPPSLNIPFVFGPVNTTSCGSTGTACIPDVVDLNASATTITLPASQQVIYSTIVMLGNAVNGNHSGTVVATYTDGTTNTFNQSFSDWCGFKNFQYESIAVGGINRLNATGTYNGATCNLYAYTYTLDVTRMLQSISLKGDGAAFVFAITLKPPTYTIDAAAANPATLAPGASATATITVNPQPGYTGTITFSDCTQGISPTIVSSGAATAPSCTLNPTSVTVTSGETTPPTTTMTFTAAKPKQAMARQRGTFFYAFWIVPGLALTGLGFSPRGSQRNRLLGWLLLGLLVCAVLSLPGCVTYKHLGNVGTPPGQYTVSITGVDQNGLTQASNPTGTTNTVVVTVTQ